MSTEASTVQPVPRVVNMVIGDNAGTKELLYKVLVEQGGSMLLYEMTSSLRYTDEVFQAQWDDLLKRIARGEGGRVPSETDLSIFEAHTLHHEHDSR